MRHLEGKNPANGNSKDISYLLGGKGLADAIVMIFPLRMCAEIKYNLYLRHSEGEIPADAIGEHISCFFRSKTLGDAIGRTYTGKNAREN